MLAFVVYFAGLICHVADENVDAREKKFAVVVTAPAHKGRVCLNQIVNGVPTPTSIDLQDDDRIRFENLTAGTARTDNDFRQQVPSLRFITDGGTLDFQIRNELKDADARAYVSFPKGTLGVYSRYDEKGIYALSGTGVTGAVCVADVTQFTPQPDANADVTVIITRNQTDYPYVVPKDSTVCIYNTIDHTGHHLDFHRRLTNSPTVMRVHGTNQKCTPVTGPTCPCAGGIGVLDSADPECSNSQWP